MTRRFTMTGAALLMTMLASARGERDGDRDDALLERILHAVECEEPAPDDGDEDPRRTELERTLKA